MSDDGHGISLDDMNYIGVRGWGSRGDGRRGETLAAIGQLGSLEVVSRVRGGDACSKWIREGVVLGVGKVECERGFGSCGTRVEVWELFGNVPVRRRVELERGDELVTKVSEVAALWACACPNVGFVAENGSNCVLMAVEACGATITKKRLQIVFGKAVAGRLSCLKISNASRRENVCLEGYVALDGVSPSLSVQIVSWNNMAVLAKSQLHKIIVHAWRNVFSSRGMSQSRSRQVPSFVVAFTSTHRCTNLTRESGGVDFTLDNYGAIESLVLQVFSDHRIKQPSGVLESIATQKRKPQLVRNGRLSLPIVKNSARLRSSLFEGSVLPVKSGFQNGSRAKSAGSHQVMKRPRNTASVTRPKSAADVHSAFRKALPTWMNPCFLVKGRKLQKAGDPMSLHDEACLSCSNDVPGQTQLKITRDMIGRMRVIGQADLKFIIARLDNALFAIDQHAISERFLFEQFQKQVLCSSTNSLVYSVTHPKPVPTLDLSPTELLVLRKHYARLLRWGWKLREVTSSSYMIASVPNLYEITLQGPDPLREFLEQLQHTPESADERRLVPNAIIDTMATCACHNAVRFGENLERSECKTLIARLESCAMPFQCAHGRPSIVPLIVLDD